MDQESKAMLEMIAEEIRSLKENINDLIGMIQLDHLHLGRICKLLEWKVKGAEPP